MSYDVFVWGGPPESDAESIGRHYRALLAMAFVGQPTPEVDQFVDNVGRLLEGRFEASIGRDSAVIHLQHGDDIALSVVEDLAWMAGLHRYDPQTEQVMLVRDA